MKYYLHHFRVEDLSNEKSSDFVMGKLTESDVCNPENYVTVAEFDFDGDFSLENLSKVFSLSQNIDEIWVQELESPHSSEFLECRSTMIGDVIEVDGRCWAVKFIGFALIPMEPLFKC